MYYYCPINVYQFEIIVDSLTDTIDAWYLHGRTIIVQEYYQQF
jgi:hypothetical protein